jgi:hypothetical protein
MGIFGGKGLSRAERRGVRAYLISPSHDPDDRATMGGIIRRNRPEIEAMYAQLLNTGTVQERRAAKKAYKRLEGLSHPGRVQLLDASCVTPRPSRGEPAYVDTCRTWARRSVAGLILLGIGGAAYGGYLISNSFKGFAIERVSKFEAINNHDAEDYAPATLTAIISETNTTPDVVTPLAYSNVVTIIDADVSE